MGTAGKSVPLKKQCLADLVESQNEAGPCDVARDTLREYSLFSLHTGQRNAAGVSFFNRVLPARTTIGSSIPRDLIHAQEAAAAAIVD